MKPKKSPIQQIHDRGMVAVIDGDRMVIVSEVKVEDTDNKVSELESAGYEVGYSNKDIVFYTESED